jgi:ribosomal protein L16 Arg81 hydroxylase
MEFKVKNINGIESLLSPLSKADFLSSYWGKSFLYIKGFEEKFASILTIEEIESFISRNEDLLQYPRVTMYNEGNIIPEARFTKGTKMRISGALGYKSENTVDIKKVNKLFTKGATFKISQFEQIYPEMKQLCNTFAESISFIEEIHLNLYYSPQKSQAFKSHFDKHDVFILQISGNKTWEVFKHQEDNPLPEYKIPRTESFLTSEKHSINLNAGDLLYIPRGMWHNVFSNDSSSLHLTVGIRPKTVIDLLYNLEVELLNKSFFRRNISLEELQTENFKQQFIGSITELLKDNEKLEQLCNYMKAKQDKIEFL